MIKKFNPRFKGSVQVYCGANFELDLKFHFYFKEKIFLILETRRDDVFHKKDSNQTYYRVLCSGEVFWINSFYLVNL